MLELLGIEELGTDERGVEETGTLERGMEDAGALETDGIDEVAPALVTLITSSCFTVPSDWICRAL